MLQYDMNSLFRSFEWATAGMTRTFNGNSSYLISFKNSSDNRRWFDKNSYLAIVTSYTCFHYHLSHKQLNFQSICESQFAIAG